MTAPISVLFYVVVCWGGSMKKRDAGRLDRLVRRAGAVVGMELDCLTSVAEKRTLSRLLTILDNDHHPLHSTINGQRSIFSGRLLSLSCSSDRLRKSFVPRAIQLFNATQKGRGREMDFSAWVYLSLPSPSHLISFIIPLSIPLLAILAPCTDLTTYISLHYPHTHTHNNSIFALSTQAQWHYLFALSTHTHT